MSDNPDLYTPQTLQKTRPTLLHDTMLGCLLKSIYSE